MTYINMLSGQILRKAVCASSRASTVVRCCHNRVVLSKLHSKTSDKASYTHRLRYKSVIFNVSRRICIDTKRTPVRLSCYNFQCDTIFVQKYGYHKSSVHNDEAKSLADKTVQILSDKKKRESVKKTDTDSETDAKQEPEVKAAVDATQLRDKLPSQEIPKQKGVAAKLKRGWHSFVKELRHYYNGFRLLFIDVRICSRYVWNVLNGATLTRRERKQLVRTTADLFRLVPFSVFVIVPFMEFLLPVALKLFPGMLPSTFAVADKEAEKVKKRLKAKLEIAKFLQDTVEESALVTTGKGKTAELAKEFSQFLKQIREDGTTVRTADIMKYAQLFKDEITLDNMTRNHLTSLCRLLEVPTIGTNKMLAFQLRVKLRQLRADDKLIAKEGLGSLSVTELQQACRARGMRAIGVPEWRLRLQLKQWLDMHLNEKVPYSMLLMSRALYLPETLSKEEQMKTIISSLSENTTAEAEIHAAEVTGEKVDPAAKLKLIQAEEEAIAREKAEEAEALKEKQKQVVDKSQEILSTEEDINKHTIEDKAPIIESVSKVDVKFDDKTEELIGAEDEPVISNQTSTSTSASEVDDESKDEEYTSLEIEQLEDVLEKIAEEKQMSLEKAGLDALREDFDEYQEDLSNLKSLVETDDSQIIESKSAKRLSSAVNRMINQLSGVTEGLHRQKQHLLEEIEVKQVRMKRSEELQHDEKAMESLQEQIRREKDDVISINELVLAMKRLQKVPDDTRLQKIAQVLDEDSDGQIQISDALRVMQELGTENVNIKGSQMKEILELLKKEADIEQEEKLTATISKNKSNGVTEEADDISQKSELKSENKVSN